jgi:hypothetical protein
MKWSPAMATSCRFDRCSGVLTDEGIEQRNDMAKRISLRLLGIALILAIGLLGLHAAIDWHAHAYDEQRCQTCQIAHAAAPQSAVQVVAQAPAPIARFAPAEESTPEIKAFRTLSIPRAPPA